jgi:lipoprotein-releasing system permease protein
MLGLGVMVLTLAVVRGFKQEIREKVRGFSGDIDIVKFDLNNSDEASPFNNDSGFVRKAAAKSLITRIMPFATKPGIIRANNEIEGVVLKGVDKTYDWSFFKTVMVAGKVMDFTDSVDAQKQIMISQTIADRLRLKVGDKIVMYFVQEPLKRRPFKVCGIYNSGVQEVDKNYVIGALSLIRRLNDWNPNQVGGYELRVANFDDLALASAFIDNILPVKLKAYNVMQYYPTIFGWLALLDTNTIVMLVLMVAVALINMVSALLIMILERTSMIGMFKAMGAGNWGIQKIFLYNALYLVGLGLILGNLFGFGIGYFQEQTHFFKLDPESYYMAFVPMQFNWVDDVLLNAGVLVVCLLVLIIPSMLVTKISPVKAIRFK